MKNAFIETHVLGFFFFFFFFFLFGVKFYQHSLTPLKESESMHYNHMAFLSSQNNGSHGFLL